MTKYIHQISTSFSHLKPFGLFTNNIPNHQAFMRWECGVYITTVHIIVTFSIVPILPINLDQAIVYRHAALLL